MKLASSLLLAATALVHTSSAEFTISSSPAAAPAKALGDNEPFAKTWTVSGAAPLGTLQLQTLGRVFVEYDASIAKDDAKTVAHVVLSGNNTDLLEAFEVINVDKKDDAIEVHMKNVGFEGHGYLLTRVVVATKQALRDVSVAWSSDTVVGDDVLVTANETASLSLSLAGSADVFVGSSDATWSVHELEASVAGSGSIQVLAKSLKADSVALSIAGSGDVGVVADEVTIKSALVSGIAGSGDITVQSDKLDAYNLTAVIGGSGDVTYSRKGSCQEQTIAIAGSGDVSSASIVCVNTEVNLVGSGDVLVQTTGDLKVSSLFGSDVKYYGKTPANITVSGLFNFRGSHKNTRKVVKEVKTNSYDEYDVKDVPERAPAYVLVKTSASIFSDEPKIRYDLELDEYDAEEVAEFLSRQNSAFHMYAVNHAQSMAMVYQSHGFSLSLFVLVGAALVAVGVAATKYHQRRARHQYAPLI